MKRKAANVDPRVRDILKSLVNGPKAVHKSGSGAQREWVTAVAQAAAISNNWVSEYIADRGVTRSERRIRRPGGSQPCVRRSIYAAVCRRSSCGHTNGSRSDDDAACQCVRPSTGLLANWEKPTMMKINIDDMIRRIERLEFDALVERGSF